MFANGRGRGEAIVMLSAFVKIPIEPAPYLMLDLIRSQVGADNVEFMPSALWKV